MTVDEGCDSGGEAGPPERSDAGEGSPEPAPGDEVSPAHVAELTADLQRVAAEYKNYRDRVQRELVEAHSRGQAEVVTELIGTLDDLDRASSHGDLDAGPGKVLADNLTAALARIGVQRFGEVGTPFDPTIHEAMTHTARAGFAEPTVTAVYQPGYRLGEKVLRAARVGVSD